MAQIRVREASAPKNADLGFRVYGLGFRMRISWKAEKGDWESSIGI